jgi:hypothetical protein
MKLANPDGQITAELARLLSVPAEQNSVPDDIRAKAVFAIAEARVAKQVTWHAREREQLIERVRAVAHGS